MNIKQTKIIVRFSLLVSLALQSCDWVDAKLVLVNNSASKIYVLDSGRSLDKGGLPEFPPYPIDQYNNRAHLSRRMDSLDSKAIPPHSSRHLELVNDYWESYLARDSVSFFVLNSAVVDSLNWKEVREKKLYLQKFHLSLDSAKRLNWRITIK